MKILARSTFTPMLVAVALAVLLAAPAAATQGQADEGLPYRATYVISATDMEMAPGYPDEQSDFDGRC